MIAPAERPAPRNAAPGSHGDVGADVRAGARSDARAVARWLAAFAAMVFIMILVGGATRLTESGLSITEWKPVTGVLPPLDEAQWSAEFAKYRQIPQYRQLNAGMSLAAFKRIYLWEYGHRLAARLVGLAFVIPFVLFMLRGRIPPHMRGRVVSLLALLLLQAAMGWWMVTSGLTARTEVSQYRLAAHLLTAFVLLGLTVWTAAEVWEGTLLGPSLPRPWTGVAPSLPRPRPGAAPSLPRARAWLLPSLAALVFLTSGAGALVAGLRAGRIYNTFPLMGDRLVAAGYGQLAPAWRNAFENPVAVQFNHRVLATLTFLAVVGAWFMLRRSANAALRTRMHLVLAAALLQFALGIATLLLAVPVTLGVAHQGGAALLLVAVLLAWHADAAPRRAPAPARAAHRSPEPAAQSL